MKHYTVFTFCVLFSVAVLSAQDVTIEKSFSFGEPFRYYEKWDRIEGGGPGFLSLLVFDDVEVMYETTNKSWQVFKNWEHVNQIKNRIFACPTFAVRQGNRLIAGCFGVDTPISIFSEKELKVPRYIIPVDEKLPDAIEINNRVPPYLSGNMLFAETAKGNLVSWELLDGGKTFYRGIAETKAWLDAGGAKRIGYKWDASLSMSFFGEFSMRFDAPLFYKNWKDYQYPKGEFESNVSLRDYIGTDKKGLSYFKIPYPRTNKKIITIEPFQFAIGILDTWTNTFSFKIFSKGTWDPPRRILPDSAGIETIGYYAWAVHPHGDIYFFDADTKKKEYQFKRIHNDWWEGLGVDKRKIGRIEENYTPLRTEARVDAPNNGFNYEREFVWVLEESTKTEILKGATSPWVKVRKLDGREGWILLSEIYFEE